jgi:tol-pal system protein YbgF
VKLINRAASAAVAGVAALALSGCFATQQDVRVLQGDISLLRSEQAAADSARRVQLDRAIRELRSATDSLSSLSTQFTRFRSDISTSMSSVDQQLLQIQELTGQSQRRLQEVRASLEERQQAATPATPGVETTPGPNQLFQIAREQMMQGSNAAARQGFQDLLDKYPKSDLAAEAQFYIAETYAAEKNASAADSVYARVASKYAGSPRAATAIYKRAVAAQAAGDASSARTLFNQVIKKYPRSDEAALARDRIRALK